MEREKEIKHVDKREGKWKESQALSLSWHCLSPPESETMEVNKGSNPEAPNPTLTEVSTLKK